ncbi:MAG: methyltransferase domain-containing protein [Xanthobacteraceae bacterium]|nr:methyltransferase domain-containing protein [Xanthobacteraceae bacterium]QYK44718.1 MAG: methyltransferase domain-containing protein [Xanthobacteraceae bacterium]
MRPRLAPAARRCHLPPRNGIRLLSTHLLFDRKLLKTREARAARAGRATFLLDHAAEELVARLGAVKREFTNAIDAGDSLGNARERFKTAARLPSLKPAPVDDETEKLLIESEGTHDLAISLLAMQWFSDLPGVLAQIKRALKPDGLLLAAIIGGETLHELREALAAAEDEREGGVSPRVSPFVEVRTLGSLLQRAGFALPVTDSESLTVRYDNALALMHDLRRMGATNVLIERSRKPLRRGTLFRATEIYAQRFSDSDGRIRASFDILWMSGWAPHESQQQPLKPGSAKMRLADALRTDERPAGEKTGPKKN